jgi:hypothetical protein
MTFQPPPPPPPPGAPPPPPPPPGGRPQGQWGPPPGGAPYPAPGGPGYPAPGAAPGGAPYGAPGTGAYAAPGGSPYGPPARGGFDPKSVNPLDWAILGIGFLVLIFSFFGFYTASNSGGAGFAAASKSAGAWHEIFGGGFFGWIAMVFAVAGTVALAITLFAPQIRMPFPGRLIALAGFAAGLLCELLAVFIHPKFFHESATILGQHFSADFGHGFSFWISLVLILAGAVLCLMRLQQTGGQLPGPLGNVPNIGGHRSGNRPPPPPPPGPGYGPPAGGGGYGPPAP